MEGQLELIAFEPLRLVYVLIPKCGSSSMLTSFMAMSGLGTRKAGRNFVKQATADGSLAKVGITASHADPQDLRRLRDLYPDYRFLANIRDPYARAVSAYHSKINRYAKNFDRKSYFRGKLEQLLRGPKYWEDVSVGNKIMHQRIAFAALLAGMQKHGVDFDIHFAQQAKLLDLDHVPFDRLLRLETLEEGFRSTMSELGLPAEMLEKLGPMPRHNSTTYRGSDSALLTDYAKAAIRSLYPDDFAKLGYPA